MSERLTVVDDNNLRFNGKILWANVLPIPHSATVRTEYLEVSADDLHAILESGRAIIELAIENFYTLQKSRLEPKGYTVTRPSIFVAKLGSSKQVDGAHSLVYTTKGYANGGIHWSIDEQQPAFAAHWHAVETAGFIPHVRTTSAASSVDMGGAYLLLRDDEER